MSEHPVSVIKKKPAAIEKEIWPNRRTCFHFVLGCLSVGFVPILLVDICSICWLIKCCRCKSRESGREKEELWLHDRKCQTSELILTVQNTWGVLSVPSACVRTCAVRRRGLGLCVEEESWILMGLAEREGLWPDSQRRALNSSLPQHPDIHTLHLTSLFAAQR